MTEFYAIFNFKYQMVVYCDVGIKNNNNIVFNNRFLKCITSSKVLKNLFYCYCQQSTKIITIL